jgi:hypothetical protein
MKNIIFIPLQMTPYTWDGAVLLFLISEALGLIAE